MFLKSTANPAVLATLEPLRQDAYSIRSKIAVRLVPVEYSGKIILLNGASSAGKSTLTRALQQQLEIPFLRFSLDTFMFSGEVLPKLEKSGPFSWAIMRQKLFQGYFACLPALAHAGNNLLVDYVLETQDQLDGLVRALGALDVFFVGVHCPLPELERRERARGDRRSGDAKRDFETVHSFCAYDFSVDSTQPADQNATEIIAAWNARSHPGVFDVLANR